MLGRPALKAVLKLLVGTGAMAGSVALVLVVQSVATYTSLVPIVRSVAAPVITPTTAYRSPQVTGVSIDNQNGFATLTMTPFTSQSGASALGAKYGMQLLTEFPAFGRYIFSLPQIRIGPGPEQHTATIYLFPYRSLPFQFVSIEPPASRQPPFGVGITLSARLCLPVALRQAAFAS